MLIFSISFPDLIKKFLLYGWIPLKEGFGGERRPKDRVTLQIILVFTLRLTHLKTSTQGCVSEFDKYLHWPCVSVKKNIYTLQQDKCKCKIIGHVSVNDLTLTLDLHAVYMAIDTYTHNTGTKQSIIM
jgi:hypothetical protein